MVQAGRAGGELLGNAPGGGRRLRDGPGLGAPEGRLLHAVPEQARGPAARLPRHRDVVPRVIRPVRTRAALFPLRAAPWLG